MKSVISPPPQSSLPHLTLEQLKTTRTTKVGVLGHTPIRKYEYHTPSLDSYSLTQVRKEAFPCYHELSGWLISHRLGLFHLTFLRTEELQKSRRSFRYLECPPLFGFFWGKALSLKTYILSHRILMSGGKKEREVII